MKKTTTINLAGLVFHIEEDGYQVLRDYFDEVKRIFSTQEGVDEMISDIEARFAELFQERLNPYKEVLTSQDVDEVIAIMGMPNELDEDFEDENAYEQRDFKGMHSNRKLFRDVDDGIIGGVAAGTAHFFNIDPVIIRVLWIIFVLLGGSGVLIYIIAWIAIPPARTTSEKLQMRGEYVNLDTIKGYAQNFGKEAKRGFNKASNTMMNSVKQGNNFVIRLGKAFLTLISILLLTIGVLSLTSLSLSFFISYPNILFDTSIQLNDNVVNTNFPTLVEVFFANDTLALFTLFILVLVPILFLIILGIKLLFSQKMKVKTLSIFLLVIWIVALISMSFIGVYTGLDFKEKYKSENKVTITEDYNQISLRFIEEDILITDFIDSDFDDFFAIEQDQIKLGYVNVQVIPTEDSLFYYTIERSSNGRTLKTAKERADRIQFEVENQDSVLTVPTRYIFSKEDKIRGQEVGVKIYVPYDKVIVLQGNLEDYPISIISSQKVSKGRLEQTSSWRSEKSGMKQID